MTDRGEPAGIASRLLVPFDGSEESRSALPYAAALATPGTKIILFTVYPNVSASTPDDERSPLPARIEFQAHELRAAGFEVTIESALGDPAEQIVAAAANGGASMIVMASHGRGVLGRLLHGSVADKVAREATVPVLIVRSAQAQPGPVGITRLVLPLDGSPLAEQSIPVALEISRRLGTPLLLVRAVNVAEFMPPAVGMGEAIPFQLYDETEEELNKAAGDYLDAEASRLRQQGFTVTTKVLSGPPASAIAEVTLPSDVVVLCSHERSGVARWLMGSVAESLVHGDDSPVLLVPASDADAAPA